MAAQVSAGAQGPGLSPELGPGAGGRRRCSPAARRAGPGLLAARRRPARRDASRIPSAERGAAGFAQLGHRAIPGPALN